MSRWATAADAPALALVAGATFLETYHAVVPGADLVAHVTHRCNADVFAEWIGDPAAAVFYAGDPATDAPVGFLVLTRPDFPIPTGPGDVELRRSYTLAAVHGQGLGAALLACALEQARSLGHSRMLLGTHPDNGRARRFYEREGFRLAGQRHFTVGSRTFHDPVYALAL